MRGTAESGEEGTQHWEAGRRLRPGEEAKEVHLEEEGVAPRNAAHRTLWVWKDFPGGMGMYIFIGLPLRLQFHMSCY